MKEAVLLKIKNLPPLSQTVMKIEELYSNPNTGIAEFARALDGDPMITANLLKLANSPLYGFSNEITSVLQAVNLFGMDTVRSFILTSATQNSIKIDIDKVYEKTADQLVSVSQQRNALMSKWYASVDRQKLKLLIPASFLSGVGRFIVAQDVIENKLCDKFKEIAKEHGYRVAEKECTGNTHQEVSAEIFDLWRFDNQLIEIIRDSGSIDEICNLSHLTNEYILPLRAVQTAFRLHQADNETINEAVKMLDPSQNPKRFKEIAEEILSLQ